MIKKKSRNIARIKRHRRVRAKIKSLRLRLNIFRSNKYIYTQIIDDSIGHTLVFANTKEKEFEDLKSKKNIKAAELLGKKIAERAIKKNINSVVFDRGGYLYHGKIKALAEAARKIGLKF
ncbi:MAG: 50S ribosomal protein L18 [Clostridiales bacterium]|nr:50S ribosomal protein L18 [Clostridiales bacterium]